MKIKNTSSKVISVMTTVLLPDEECETSAEVVALPSVKALIEKNFLKVIADEPKATEAPKAEETVAEAVAETAEETKAEVKADEPKATDTKKADAKKATAKK